jgi:hypothetical protein
MVGSGSTAAMRVLPTDYRAGRPSFRTVQASRDQVDESRTAIGGGRPGPDMFPVGNAGYRKSYIAAESTR